MYALAESRTCVGDLLYSLINSAKVLIFFQKRKKHLTFALLKDSLTDENKIYYCSNDML